MKRLAFSIIVLFFAVNAHAQVHGKILIVADLAKHGVGPFFDAINAHYTGSKDEMNYIPGDLSGYDAIMIQWNYSIKDSVSEQALINYLKQGGKVYLEGGMYDLQVNDTVDRFMSYCGVSRPGPVSMVAIRFNGIRSPSSEYTNGLDTAWTRPNPVDYDLDQPWGLGGNLASLMCAQEEDFSDCDPIAWRPADTSIHAVIYWTIRPELYDKFIQRTLCNYFGLCEAASVRSAATSKFSISPNPSHRDITITLTDERESSVEIADVLGNVMLHKQTMGNMQWKPKHDGPAVYFVRVSTGGAVSTQRVVFE